MIREYTDSDFEVLNAWITDSETLFRFSGPDWDFPLTREQLNAYISAHPLRQFYMGLQNGEAFAFGEIITGDEFSPRLGRLIVDRNKRSRGLGQTFVNALISECIKRHASSRIFLFVLEDNKEAIACYQKCGFEFSPGGHLRMDMQGRPVEVLKMQHICK